MQFMPKTKPSTLIEFSCPRCTQQYRASDRAPGSDIVCETCQHTFQIPGNLEQWLALKAAEEAEILARPARAEAEAQSETQKLFRSGEDTSQSGTWLIIIAILAALIGFATDAPAIGMSVGGGLFSLGIAMKIIGQLILIRAEIRAKK